MRQNNNSWVFDLVIWFDKVIKPLILKLKLTINKEN
jgi:hypothetical protein